MSRILYYENIFYYLHRIVIMEYFVSIFLYSTSDKVVLCRKKWACQRVFGLSMQVYGSVNSHVMNYMAMLVMTEQKHNLDNNQHNHELFPTRYIMMHEDAVSERTKFF